jgi:hypothetical protein
MILRQFVNLCKLFLWFVGEMSASKSIQASWAKKSLFFINFFAIFVCVILSFYIIGFTRHAKIIKKNRLFLEFALLGQNN